HQLTKFTGKRLSPDHCIDALRLASNLVKCNLAIDANEMEFVEILTHSSLKSLTLVKDGRSCTDIFQSLTLPALETLKIFDCPYNMFNNPEFQEFLERSSPPLRRFVLQLDHDTGLRVSAFALMPNLVELEIWNPNELAIPMFFFHLNDVAFLPQLRDLSFFHPCHSWEGAELSELESAQTGLKARWEARHHGVAALESFCLLWSQDFGDFPEDTLTPFRTMVSEGLDILIASPTRIYI
ncbi:hypothetical protein C8R45DRAFT_839343, partial [Mycena sanguinolenta]